MPSVHYPLYRAAARSWRKQTSRLATLLARQPAEVARLVERYGRQVELLRNGIAPVDADEWTRKGIPPALALELAALSMLDNSLAIADIALDSKRGVAEVRALFEEIGSRFGFARLQRIADDIQTSDAMDFMAVRQVASGIRRHHERLCRCIVEASPAGLDSGAAVGGWLEACAGTAEVRQQILALDRPGSPWTLGRLLMAGAAIERAVA